MLAQDKGVSLIELVVGAALLGIVSLGIFSVMNSLQDTTSRYSEDVTIEGKVQEIRSALRSKRSCNLSLSGLNPSNDSFENAIGEGDFTEFFDEQGNIFAEVGGIYRTGTGGSFELMDMRVWGAREPDYAGEPIPVTLSLVTQRVGSDRTSLGASQRMQHVSFFVILEEDPPHLIQTCFTPLDSYILSACNAIGGVIDWRDRRCKETFFGHEEESYNLFDMDDLSQGYEVFVDRSKRIKGNLEVGFSEAIAMSDLPFLNDPPDIERESGVALIEKLLFIGYPDQPVPLMHGESPDEDDSLTGISLKGGFYLGFSDGEYPEELPGRGAAIKGNLIAGNFDLTDGDDIDFIDSSQGEFGNILLNGAIRVNLRDDADSEGIHIIDDGAPSGGALLSFGDLSFFTPGSIDDSLALRLSSDPSIGTANLGGEKDGSYGGAVFRGDNGGIAFMGSDQTDPPDESFHVRGRALFYGNIYVADGMGVNLATLPDFPDDYRRDQHTDPALGPFEDLVPTIGWVANRIAQVLSADSDIAEEMASDILQESLGNNDDSAYTQMLIHICENTVFRDGDRAFSNNGRGEWNNVEGRCEFRPQFCDQSGVCDEIFADQDLVFGNNLTVDGNLIVDGDFEVRHLESQHLVTVLGDILIEGDAQLYGLARGRPYILVQGELCTGGECYTKFETRTCATYMLGVLNGHVFCYEDF